MEQRTTTKKLIDFERGGRVDLAWLVDHGFAKNDTDAAKKAVTLARRVLEAVV